MTHGRERHGRPRASRARGNTQKWVGVALGPNARACDQIGERRREPEIGVSASGGRRAVAGLHDQGRLIGRRMYIGASRAVRAAKGAGLGNRDAPSKPHSDYSSAQSPDAGVRVNLRNPKRDAATGRHSDRCYVGALLWWAACIHATNSPPYPRGRQRGPTRRPMTWQCGDARHSENYDRRGRGGGACTRGGAHRPEPTRSLYRAPAEVCLSGNEPLLLFSPFFSFSSLPSPSLFLPFFLHLENFCLDASRDGFDSSFLAWLAS